MKKTLFLFVLPLLFYTPVFAQSSGLIFFTQGSEPFFVFLDGVKQNNNPGSNVKIFGLEGNRYNVLIVIPHPVFAMVNYAVKITPNKESVYAISKNVKGDYELMPKGESQLSFTPSSPGQQIIKFVSHLPAAAPMPPGVGAGLNVMTGNTQQTAVTYNENTTLVNVNTGNTNSNPNYLPGYTGPVGCARPMSANEFQNAKNTISSKSFESAKLTLAKQISGANCLLSSQVKDLMELFSFEGSKIEFAKFGYAHTYDKGNYFMVNEAFDFDSSIEELNKYINK